MACGFVATGELRRPDEAERVLRAAVAARQPEIVVPLAFLLEDQGRYREAEQTLRDGVAAGDPYARFRLAELLQRLERTDEAEQICRAGIAASDRMVVLPSITCYGSRDASKKQSRRGEKGSSMASDVNGQVAVALAQLS